MAEAHTITALNAGRHTFEYDWPIVPITKPAKEPTADDRAKWLEAGGVIREVRLGSIDDHDERTNAPKPRDRDERAALDDKHPPRSVKVPGPQWEALWASQKPALQAAMKAGDIQIQTGDVLDPNE